MKNVKHFSANFAEVIARLPGPDSEDPNYDTLFERGTVELLIYSPKDVDNQEIHNKDEFYFIASGSGKFFNGMETISVTQGDAIFVAAGVEHRFLDFTDDLSTWVVFFESRDGEQLE